MAVGPGPDLAWQDAVMQSEAFIISENICIPTSRRALRGVGSTSRRPGRARELTRKVYGLTRKNKFARDFGLKVQGSGFKGLGLLFFC